MEITTYHNYQILFWTRNWQSNYWPISIFL